MAFLFASVNFDDYGITPGRIKGGNVAVEGCFDMPSRIGKTYHEWGDEHGIEPYVESSDMMWWRAGEAHHHIVDPRTGSSAEPVWRSVSVAAGSCLAANTVSTAAIVRGRRAPAWISSLGLAARLVDADGRESTIGGWPS